ncbi:Tungsten-containing aldehyde:ferredoxin oxidoreductase (EC [Olavius algarvensis Delta 1 endosymbiont]|nr:Tungsten-containing aldehyde:ferredoxin oxidoreductase (EC [Olavius algarvensis Delta 1 endosymbiont]
MIPPAKIFEIDLTQNRIKVEEYTEGMAGEHLAGFGFNIKTLFQRLTQTITPLDPANILMITRGLLTGTAAPASSRIHLSALSPLSGLIASSNVGGFFGSMLQTLDIMGLIITGKAPRPIYIRITSNGVDIEDADGLWGLDTRQTQTRLRSDLGDERAQVLCIGPAGENQVRFAGVLAGKDHAAGRTGLGAVFGSKNIKALVVQAEKVRPKMSEAAAKVVKHYIRNMKTNTGRFHDYATYGSSGDVLETNEWGLLGTRNYRLGQVPDALGIDGRGLQKFVFKKNACPRCPVHCKADIEIRDGDYKGFRGGRPEYETVMKMGPLCGLSDPRALLYLTNLCNILGLDTISTGGVIAFAMDLFDRGIITPDDTGGLILRWGDAAVIETLIRQIATCRGLGKILARGVRKAAEIFGKNAEDYAYHVKGVEIYGADPRGLMGTALSYAVSLRGGDFTSVYPIPEYRYTPEKAKREFGTDQVVNLTATEGKGGLVKKCMIVSMVIDSLGLCKVPTLAISANYDLVLESQLIKAITGLDLSTADLFFIGERLVNLEKLFNLRHGSDFHADNLPDLFVNQPLTEGPAKGLKVNLEPMVQDFYHCMGWDEKGIPTSDTLRRLGLEGKPELKKI